MQRAVAEVSVNGILTKIEVNYSFISCDDIYCVPIDPNIKPFYTHYKSMIVGDRSSEQNWMPEDTEDD